MINHISISDFAIIENTEIDFEDGLNIITGETGSGKSIVIEAISLALGSRADSSFVRFGKDKAIIQLQGYLNDEEVVITREISSAGKNLCRLNGRIVSLTELGETCRKLADIHGQYDNQSLLNNENHIKLVDKYKEDVISPLLSSYYEKYTLYLAAKQELNKLLSLESENLRKLDFYKFELEEINKANLVVGEDQELSERISLLQNSEKIFSSVEQTYNNLNEGSESVLTSLGANLNSLQGVSQYSKDIAELTEEIADIYYRLEDVSSNLRDIKEQLIYSPSELDNSIARLDLVENLKKKYGGSIESVLEYRDKIDTELNQIENFDQVKEELTAKANNAFNQMSEAANALSCARKESANELSTSIESELHDLNFDGAKLSIDFKVADTFGPDGNDIVEILISTNKGEPLKPLVRVASGGEISRIMLAIKNITGTYDNIPTMIFDEIDAGISGITASIVGRKLREISKNHQIICITHLPQIAACGDYNYRIYKESTDEKTFTYVEKLSEDTTVNEIARLLGGDNITDITLESAKELMRSAGHFSN